MANARVLVSDKLSDGGLAILRNAQGIEVDYKPGLSEDELAAAIGGYEALVIRSGSKVTAKILERATRLRVIGRAGIGVDNVDVPAASRRGAVVMNTPTGNTVTTAEHAISLLLSLARRVPQATASMRAGKWEKNKFQGSEVTGKTLGVIGLGNIGRIVADRARGLKMNVIGFDPVLTQEKAAQLGVALVCLDELFARADFITLHTPLNAETKNLLCDDSFAKMKQGVLIVNAARGGVVDEAALVRAIESGKVGGAALDVFPKEPPDPESPVLKNEKIILTPHLGASTDEAQERVALEIAQQVIAFLTTGAVQNAVNVPSLAPELAAQLEPYLVTADKLGRLLAQLVSSGISEFKVTCTGTPGRLGSRPLASAALAAYLQRFLDLPVNAVSAPFHASERGIAFTEARQDATERLQNTIRVEVRSKSESRAAEGALGADGRPRIVTLDGCEVEAQLLGTTLVTRNQDRPGVIGVIGSILGANRINVSHMQLGLDEASKEAVGFWRVDQPIPTAVMDELRRVTHVRSVVCVEL